MSKPFGAVAITDADIDTILERMGDGITLMQSCRKSKKSYSNVVRRIGNNPELKHLHARCREEYVRAQVDKMHDIAGNTKLDAATRRMMIDLIKWESARVLPKEYGDRVQQEVIITNNTTLSQRMALARERAAAKAVSAAALPKPVDPDQDE